MTKILIYVKFQGRLTLHAMEYTPISPQRYLKYPISHEQNMEIPEERRQYMNVKWKEDWNSKKAWKAKNTLEIQTLVTPGLIISRPNVYTPGDLGRIVEAQQEISIITGLDKKAPDSYLNMTIGDLKNGTNRVDPVNMEETGPALMSKGGRLDGTLPQFRDITKHMRWLSTKERKAATEKRKNDKKNEEAPEKYKFLRDKGYSRDFCKNNKKQTWKRIYEKIGMEV